MTLRHPRLAHALMLLRPGAKSGVDFIVMDNSDGKGPFLADGSMRNPPTQQEVDALTDDDLDLAQASKHGFAPISDRQFFQYLAAREIITKEEALAAVKTGELPSRLSTAIASMPDSSQFAARMMLSGATVFEREHPMTKTLAQIMSWSRQDIDRLWHEAEKL